MVSSPLRLTVLLGLAVSLVPAAASAQRVDQPAVDFGREIVPLLRDNCFRCHEGRDAPAEVRLDLRAALTGETGSDPLVIPGNSGESRLIEVVSGADPDVRMPPEGDPLTTDEVALLSRWIDGGLAWDADVLPERESDGEHWAFQPVRRPAVPVVAGDDWSRTPIDRFVVAAQRAHGVRPAKEASRRILIRRLYLDLWGVPPRWDEVEAFLGDDRADAVGRLVDHLLADPRYGERWGRHWLDVARWAESEGFESNHPRPFAWRYRDYVVQAFNGDKPFDEFVGQQIAGDELPEYSDENLIATGFLAAARISSNEEDKWLQRNDVMVDVVNAVGSAFLGLTVRCAQCHDHKFDPISTRDYYALHAFFARGLPLNVELSGATVRAEYERNRRPEYEQAVALQQTLFEKARQRFYADVRAQLTPEELRVYDMPSDQRTPEQEIQARRIDLKFQKTPKGIEKYIDSADEKLYAELKKRIEELEDEAPPAPQTFAFYSPVTSPHPLHVLPSIGFYPLPYEPDDMARRRTYVMLRGDVHQLGPDVQPDVPAVLRVADAESRPRTRRDLADWMTSPDQPLVARVWVNRIWQYHFGRGLVATADDFGTHGSPPTHPKLLDWLAAELMDNGWSTKHIQRLILTSAVYRQSAEAAPGAAEQDPENRWLTRWTPRRFEAETIRDAWLATTGELDLQVGGASVPLEERETSLRRSLYLFQRRGHATDVERLFDGPQECAASVARRDVSTSPLQSLYLLNSGFSVDRARVLAERLREQSTEQHELIRAAFRQVLLRDPDSEELAAAVDLWNTCAAGEPLEALCQALLNLNEFNYLE